ncbi:MAG: hypothetical protein LBF37_00575, partial [Rickettsiales bacterium]|nr:hypothetical protein [Rickettsiales bacterium]
FTQAFSGYFKWCKDLNKTPRKAEMHKYIYKSSFIKEFIFNRITGFHLERFEDFDINCLNSASFKDSLLFGSNGNYLETLKRCLIAVPWISDKVLKLLGETPDIMKVFKQYHSEDVGNRDTNKLLSYQKELESLGWPMTKSYYIEKSGGSLTR